MLHKVTHLITIYVSVQSPTFRVTRARLHTQDHEHALEILEEQTMPVVVDHGRLTKFLDSTVSLTKDFKIEKLEKLYSLYSSCIYSHCQDYDKTLMIEVSMVSRVCWSAHATILLLGLALNTNQSMLVCIVDELFLECVQQIRI